ncbi:BCD family MFS transporter [Congregibacter variabilis]|uniref:BCD family MFS transporter n=1 Tax=Congregibacter variabilis TaxID=3081200 RepID=A0ABZ0I387_9GAMM|nr:BCD family MFS transporter [Congregibacter sp. IMCC43200]
MTLAAGLSWIGIVRLGLVQTSLGAIIVLTTTVINRVMVVELALPAMLPGILVGVHHAVQMSRPRFGHGSDVGGRTTGWIIGGMIVLALGGIAAALGTVLVSTNMFWGLIVSTLAFVAIGLGASAAGTSTLVTLAKHVAPHRKAAAATIVWIMMIAGFAITAGVAGSFLDPFTPLRLVMVTASVSAIAVTLTLVSVFRLEPKGTLSAANREALRARRGSFSQALREVWQEPDARRFTIFVFVSMLAYSAQDLILEPYAGIVFSMTPGESTSLSGLQHSGVLLGMILVAATTLIRKNASSAVLRRWTIGGCLASALSLAAIASGAAFPQTWPLGGNVFVLGVSNGAFAVAAIASMMSLASAGQKEGAEGLRMGLWGASQAIAFAVGGFLGALAIDVSRLFIAEPAVAYSFVFSLEAVMFVVAAGIGMRLRPTESSYQRTAPSFGEIAMVEVLDAR